MFVFLKYKTSVLKKLSQRKAEGSRNMQQTVLVDWQTGIAVAVAPRP